jgi:hypothetical protein
MPDEREQVIRERAYAIWEQEGRPVGKDVEHWLRAEAEIDAVEDLRAELKEFGYERFGRELLIMTAHTAKNDCEKFALEEFIRFNSICGTIIASFKNVSTDISERIITHILMRSILENYFWLLYIFYEDDRLLWSTRFDEYLNGFKIEYAKLYAEPSLPQKSKIESPDPSWQTLRRPMDINSILIKLRNDYGNKLNYLYFLYRISSFDTHGKSLPSLFNSAFGKECNFPYLRIERAIDLIANQYLAIWQRISET